jgi:two-component system, sensor histidine kinase and response regulator
LGLLRAETTAGRPLQLALIDAEMPGMSGEDLGRLIHTDPQLEGVTRLILLSSLRVADPVRLQTAGFAVCLSRPVKGSELYNAMQRVLRDDAGQPPPPATRRVTPREAPAAEVWLLVAEDNEINQELTREILEQAGYRVDCVRTGRAAVAAAERKAYALIFMDCQMPEMDGYEATRQIREREWQMNRRAGRGRVPIVALTADALKGTRDQCLQAGMDDYLSKPLDPAAVVERVRKWIPEDGTLAVASNAAPTRGAPESGPVLVYEELLERCIRKPEVVAKVLEMFIGQATKDVEAIANAVARGDAHELHELAHRVKGASANMAAGQLRDVAEALEEMGRENRMEGSPPKVEELRREFVRLRDHVNAHYLGQRSPA